MLIVLEQNKHIAVSKLIKKNGVGLRTHDRSEKFRVFGVNRAEP